MNVDQQVHKVSREYKVNLEKLESLIPGGEKRFVQILEQHWSMKVTTKLSVFCLIKLMTVVEQSSE